MSRCLYPELMCGALGDTLIRIIATCRHHFHELPPLTPPLLPPSKPRLIAQDSLGACSDQFTDADSLHEQQDTGESIAMVTSNLLAESAKGFLREMEDIPSVVATDMEVHRTEKNGFVAEETCMERNRFSATRENGALVKDSCVVAMETSGHGDQGDEFNCCSRLGCDLMELYANGRDSDVTLYAGHLAFKAHR